MDLDIGELLRFATPLEDHLTEYGLLVKREDLSCPPPGPPFSKMRGVISHMEARYAEGVRLFGVLDTVHSQAGHAVALGARALGVRCVNFFPVYKREIRTDVVPSETPVGAIKILGDGVWCELREPQLRAQSLGSEVSALNAGRSAVLFHFARKAIEAVGGYMMPNALKLPETVTETAAEVIRTVEHASRAEYQLLRSIPWIVAMSSGTVAAGVIRGLGEMFERGARPPVVCHMGYSRPEGAARSYILDKARTEVDLTIIDERYAYADKARPGEDPPWPCNEFYDLKAFRWWLEARQNGGLSGVKQAVLWNIG